MPDVREIKTSTSDLLARLHFISELIRVRKDLLALPRGPESVIQRLRLIKRANQIRADGGLNH